MGCCRRMGNNYGKFWDGKFHKEVTKNYAISFCTTCMGRLYNLKETLPQNIEDNKAYPNLEFVILDYNSKDNLWEWMSRNMMDHILSGRVSYYRTTEPKYFSMSHSRNIAYKVAKGEIVNNLDADNYTVYKKNQTAEHPYNQHLGFLLDSCQSHILSQLQKWDGARQQYCVLSHFPRVYIE